MTEIPAFSWQCRSQLILGILQGWVATYIKLQLSPQNMVFSGCPMHSPHLICQSISLKKKKSLLFQNHCSQVEPMCF